MKVHDGTDEFEVEQDRLDVTSLSRPDTNWSVVDKSGHEHYWAVDGQRAKSYRPDVAYYAYATVKVVDSPATDDYCEVSHLECLLCREHIHPRTCADETTQYIAGLKHYRINGLSVSKEEFERRAAHLR